MPDLALLFPVEITCHIFALVLGQKVIHNFDHRSLYALRALLCSVCSSWFSVVISNPLFWSSIRVCDRMSLEAARTFLQRSGTVPLHVVLDFMDTRHGRDYLITKLASLFPSHIGRVHALRLNASTSSTVVSLHAVFGNLSAPRLRYLYLHFRPPS
ncbi:hypothetical protein C8R43DRAFT_1125405 [Mycena crocata]|nr:hypothetical protein C8R43DRAFT_1125405 [Mycena crocata]